MENRSHVSQTAMLIASLRALACYEEDPRIQGDDLMAELFLPEDKRIPLKAAEYRPVIKKAVPEGLYEYVIARTKFFDDLFSRYLELNVPQIVILGAGYDSRAYRFADRIIDTTIFEVDRFDTQEMKRQILKSSDVTIPDHIRYVSADLEENDLFLRLAGAGFQGSLQTLYLMEGVTFYLTPESMDFLFRSLRQHSQAGSVLSFDYQYKDDENALVDTGLKDESIKFGLGRKECDTYLNRFGYSAIENLDSEEMSCRYLTMTGGGSFGKVKPMMNIVTAQMG